jgi:hypothetical protein
MRSIAQPVERSDGDTAPKGAEEASQKSGLRKALDALVCTKAKSSASPVHLAPAIVE